VSAAWIAGSSPAMTDDQKSGVAARVLAPRSVQKIFRINVEKHHALSYSGLAG
jgi:hypothetical protein